MTKAGATSIRKDKYITSRRLFVVLAMADRTITGRSSGKLRMRPAISFILSEEATDDPPNFITTLSCAAFPSASSLEEASFSTTAEVFFSQLTFKALLFPKLFSSLNLEYSSNSTLLRKLADKAKEVDESLLTPGQHARPPNRAVVTAMAQ